MKRLTDLITEGFVWGVGITEPKPNQWRRAGIYITTLLLAALLAIGVVFLFVVHTLAHKK